MNCAISLGRVDICRTTLQSRVLSGVFDGNKLDKHKRGTEWCTETESMGRESEEPASFPVLHTTYCTFISKANGRREWNCIALTWAITVVNGIDGGSVP